MTAYVEAFEAEAAILPPSVPAKAAARTMLRAAANAADAAVAGPAPSAAGTTEARSAVAVVPPPVAANAAVNAAEAAIPAVEAAVHPPSKVVPAVLPAVEAAVHPPSPRLPASFRVARRSRPLRRRRRRQRLRRRERDRIVPESRRSAPPCLRPRRAAPRSRPLRRRRRDRTRVAKRAGEVDEDAEDEVGETRAAGGGAASRDEASAATVAPLHGRHQRGTVDPVDSTIETAGSSR